MLSLFNSEVPCKDDSKARVEFPLVPVSLQPKLDETVEEEWSYYIDGFFALIGNDKHLPIPLEALSRKSLSKYLWPGDENPVWHAAIAIGAAFRSFQGRDADIGDSSCSQAIAGSAVQRAKDLIDKVGSPDGPVPALPSVIAVLLITIYLVRRFNAPLPH